MGVVNVTPDSFSDGGVHLDPEVAAAAARRMVGGRRRDRRRRRRVDAAGLRRASRWTRSCGASCRCSSGSAGRCPCRSTPRSPEVARRALELGAVDGERRHGLPRRPGARGGRRRARRVRVPHAHARRAANDASGSALRRRRVARSPRSSRSGSRSPSRTGSAKSASASTPASGSARPLEHNLELVRRLDILLALGRPVLIGFSRKSSLGKLAGDPNATTGTAERERRRGGCRLRARRDDPPRPRRAGSTSRRSQWRAPSYERDRRAARTASSSAGTASTRTRRSRGRTSSSTSSSTSATAACPTGSRTPSTTATSPGGAGGVRCPLVRPARGARDRGRATSCSAASAPSGYVCASRSRRCRPGGLDGTAGVSVSRP